MKERASGILLPVFSLPSDYGIGTFGKEAYEFIDILNATRQKYWQVLPLCPTGYGDSPYQSFSTFAGNPYFIDLDILVSEDLLSKEECDEVDFGSNNCCIEYEKLYHGRYALLEKAFERFVNWETKDYTEFIEQNALWLHDYCLYMAIKGRFNHTAWWEWDEDIKFRQSDALQRYTEELAEEIKFHYFLQYCFIKQWKALKKYANEKEIRIFGDLPIYTALDSADVWANPSLFQLDKGLNPQYVAGVPPDAFSDQGQLWGNPLYNWEYHKNEGYHWWINRIAHATRLFDMVRIDHFRAFDAYWSIPYGEANAVVGEWCQGPGMDLFLEMKGKLGHINIVAEDLGVQTEGLHKLLQQTGFPGMKVLQFGINDGEDSEHLPHNYTNESIVYTGTHDNSTLLQWYRDLNGIDRAFLNRYCRVTSDKPNYDIIATIFQSTANLVIIPLQDYLELGGEARINRPSTVEGNWRWRLDKGQLHTKIQNRITELTKTFFR